MKYKFRILDIFWILIVATLLFFLLKNNGNQKIKELDKEKKNLEEKVDNLNSKIKINKEKIADYENELELKSKKISNKSDSLKKLSNKYEKIRTDVINLSDDDKIEYLKSRIYKPLPKTNDSTE